jgi:hypothetical protein
MASNEILHALKDSGFSNPNFSVYQLWVSLMDSILHGG